MARQRWACVLWRVSCAAACLADTCETKGQLAEPLLVIIGGNSGLRRAVRECLPDSWVQRRQVHRMRNILCKLPSYKAGLTEARAIVAMYEEDYPEATRCLGTDLEEVLTALRFPEAHRKRIRTTNLLERLFGEGPRRTKLIPRFMNEKSGLGLMFAVLVDASASWHGIRITPAIGQELERLGKNPGAKPSSQLSV